MAQLASGRRGPLLLLGLLGTVKAVAIVLLAEALATGMTRVIAGSDEWRRSILLGLLAATLRAGSDWAMQVVSGRTAIGEKEALRGALARRVLARGGRDLDKGRGELSVLATRGLDELDNYHARYLPALVGALVVPLIVGLRILSLDLISAVILVITVPLVPIYMALIGSFTHQRVAQAADSLARLSNHLVELGRGLPVLIGLGRATEQTAALTAISEGYRRRTMATLRVAFLSALALELIAMFSVALIAVFIGVRLQSGSLALQTGLLILILAPECYLPYREVGAAHHAAQDGVESLNRVRRVVDRPFSRLVPARTGPPGGHIVVKDLTVRFADRASEAIETLSFSVPAGAIAALTGPSGSGKTTVIAAVAGLLGDTVARGDGPGIRVDGAVLGVDRDKLAWVPQHPTSYAESVAAEVALGGSQVDVAALLTRLGISHLAERDPGGLSPGEWRLVAVARALARVETGATLLLLDEPTAHLDSRSAQIVRDAISSLRGSVTTILATHDHATQALADVLVPLDGHAVESAARVPETPGGEHRETGLDRQNEPSRSRGGSLVSDMRSLVRLLDLRGTRLTLTVVLSLLASFSSVALTAISGWLIVRASERPPILLLTMAIVGVRFFGLGRAVFRYGERLAMHDTILEAATGLRVRVWQGLIAQGPAVQRRLRGSTSLDNLIGDIDRLRDLTPRLLFPPVVGLLIAVGATVVLAIILPASLPIMLTCSVLGIGLAPAVAIWADRQAASAEMTLRSKVFRHVSATFDAAADIRVNGLDRQALARMESLDRDASTAMRRGAWASGLAASVGTLACLLASLAMLYASAEAREAGELSTEMVAVLALAPLTLIEPFVAVSAALRQLPALRMLVHRFDWLEQMTAGIPSSAAGELGQIDEIGFERLTVGWPGQRAAVIRDLSTAVARGQWLTITGPSGSGKSTLLAAVMGFLRPWSGSYRIDGRDALDVSPAAIRSRIAWCPQEAHLFDSTLRANLLLSRPRDSAPTDVEMTDVLTRVGLLDLLSDLPNGLETRIGSQGASLSGGQRQRVAVARALLTGADVLLIDEPTAHLDRSAANRLIDDLHESLQNRVVIAVTHRTGDLRSNDRRVELAVERR